MRSGLVMGLMALLAAGAQAQQPDKLDSLGRRLVGRWVDVPEQVDQSQLDSVFTEFRPGRTPTAGTYRQYTVRTISDIHGMHRRVISHGTMRWWLLYGVGEYRTQSRMCTAARASQSCNRVSFYTGGDGTDRFSFGLWSQARVK